MIKCTRHLSKYIYIFFFNVGPPKEDIFSGHLLNQGWPHFLCSGQKNGLKKLGGHNNVSKKLGGHNLTM